MMDEIALSTISEQENTQNVEYRSDDGSIVITEFPPRGELNIKIDGYDFAELLPEGCIFIYKNTTSFHLGDNTVGVNVKEYINRPDFILVLLHEIGHAIDYQANPKDLDDWNQYRLDVMQYEGRMSLTSSEYIKHLNDLRIFTDLVEKTERIAWTYALDIFQKLCRSGHDLRKVFKDENHFLHLISKRYKSYRFNAINKGNIQSNKDNEDYKNSILGYSESIFETHYENDIKKVIHRAWNFDGIHIFREDELDSFLKNTLNLYKEKVGEAIKRKEHLPRAIVGGSILRPWWQEDYKKRKVEIFLEKLGFENTQIKGLSDENKLAIGMLHDDFINWIKNDQNANTVSEIIAMNLSGDTVEYWIEDIDNHDSRIKLMRLFEQFKATKKS